MSAAECGAACVAMVLQYHGVRVTTAECRERVGAGREGATALAIMQAARSYGLRVRAYSCEPTDLAALPLPAIVHWGFNHFVVLERWSGQRARIVDPAVGRRVVTAREFDEAFTGVVLTFEAGAHSGAHAAPARDEPSRAGATVLRTYLHTVLDGGRGLRGTVAQIAGASLLVQALGLVAPALTKFLVDRVLPAELGGVLPAVGLGLALVVLSQAVVNLLRATLLTRLQGRLDMRLMLGFIERLLTLPFAFFRTRTTGDLLMRLSSNATIRNTLTSQVLASVVDGGMVVVYLAILLAAAPRFAAVVSAVGAAEVLLIAGTARRMHGLALQELAAQAQSQSYAVEALKGVATIKASGAEDFAFDRWSDLFLTYLASSLRRSQASAVLGAILSALHTAAPLLLLWIGAHLVLHGQMSVGDMLALNVLAAAFLAPLGSLVSQAVQLQLIGAHFERVIDVARAEPEQLAGSARPAAPLTGRVTVRALSFRYEPTAPDVLHDISLDIPAGQHVAIVGRTGSGKSTLAHLLLGLYAPTTGAVLYDGVDLRTLTYATVRRQLGVVLQDAHFFSGSIRRNVTLADPSISLDRVTEACQLAAVHADITHMSMGYETILSEGGGGLSGGQLQRLSLARALVRRPALLLLDEATSHLDAQTERTINERLDHLACTRITVAHRLSSVRNADRIIVLDRGRIAEQGTHDELLAAGGLYADLVGSQLLAGITAADDAARAGAAPANGHAA